jgi:hypothetical protein
LAHNFKFRGFSPWSFNPIEPVAAYYTMVAEEAALLVVARREREREREREERG